ncbi:receptor-like protein EIX2 [Hevea brasiliensis]|uniref:receptor-like protein EIX2 n=1 Tax=Hevea brasiliensis TaxID=3981 RepID=UPI0025DB1885|nr:receptor-like protein EIX2 [Hevea brasiliensis]
MDIFSVLKVVLTFICLIVREFACNVNAQMMDCLESDREALVDFRKGLIDPGNRLSTWQGTNCCQWQGIICDGRTGAVITVDLHNPHPPNVGKVLQDSIPSDSSAGDRYGFWNLSGKLRPSLTALKSLRHLDLSFNSFIGIPIPSFFDSWENLQYLNLSNAGFSGVIPPNLGNLTSLQYLDVTDYDLHVLSAENLDWVTGLVSLKYLAMSGVNLSVVGSNWAGQLNKLPHLTELHLYSCLLSGSIASPISVNFTSLAVVDLSFNSFNSRFPAWLANISSLVSLDVSFSSLNVGRFPHAFSELPNLRFLKLVDTFNKARCSKIFTGSWKKIEVLDLSFNRLYGKLPASLGNMTSLTYLSLYWNDIQGRIPSSIGKLCNLKYLSLRFNNLKGKIPEFLGGTVNCTSETPFPSLEVLVLSSNQLVGQLPNWLGSLKNLAVLDLEYNSLQGPIPPLGNLKKLVVLKLAENELNGTLPDSLQYLSELYELDVSNNHFTGIFSEAHFSKLSKLKTLYLSGNSFILNVTSFWVPPFQLESLYISSCCLNSSFPVWLKSQSDIIYLHFSNASVSGIVPDWFWDMSANLKDLNASFNQLQGRLPNPLKLSADVLDLSSNLFEGHIPLPSVPISVLDLSNNQLSGPIPNRLGEVLATTRFFSLSGNQLTGVIPISLGDMMSAQVIDLSRNNLTGSIPSNLGNCSSLKVLDLQHNNLSGEIPGSLSQLNMLQTLHLSNNKFSGEILSFLHNWSSLETLDLGYNRLTGNIPPLTGNVLPNLRILSLRSNTLSGEIPSELSNLSSLQILDLAENALNGTIPASFINLKAMAQVQRVNHYLFFGMSARHYYEESFTANLKNQFQTFTKTLSILTSLDLSGNNLDGKIPEGLMKLAGLMVLNLSGNNFTGQIPESVSELKQLLSLDLSSNKLSGPIPPSISSLSFLGYLNLSNNNLSGEIPYKGQITTFDAPSFAGNPALCGAPLDVNCIVTNSDNKTRRPNKNDGNNGFIDKWFYLSIGLGFAAGILVPFLVLAIRGSWSHAYFLLVDKTVEKILYLAGKDAMHCRNHRRFRV